MIDLALIDRQGVTIFNVLIITVGGEVIGRIEPVTRAARLTGQTRRANMAEISITHWIIMIVMVLAFVVSPILGIVRGVKNGGVLNAVMSVLFPVYGLVYFVAARQPRG